MSMLDESARITTNPQHARQLLRQYREAKGPRTDADKAIMSAFRAIARGQVVIQAAESIRKAGWGADGFPKLAMTRANAERCVVSCSSSGTAIAFHDASSRAGYVRARYRVENMPPRENTPYEQPAWSSRRWAVERAEALVPLIPLPHRPQHNLRNYWILWEAVWQPARAPRDPLLLRHLEGDLWLVLAAWDLTDVERAVIEQRVTGR